MSSAVPAEDETVPWLGAGPAARRGEIRGPVRNVDTAATAAWALGLVRPDVWDVRQVEVAVARHSPPRP